MSVRLKDNRARQLLSCWQAGVAATDPRGAVLRALDELAGDVRTPWIIALGKAAHPMAEATIHWLRRHGGSPAGGLLVAPEVSPGDPLPSLPGDHPVPGPRSALAAERLGQLCETLPAYAPVWVLLSGGTSSLIGGPATGLTTADLRESFQVLLESGLDIRRMNQVRKRLSRWGGGQLLEALGDRPILQLVVSDVPGDDLGAIGSGPLIPDETLVSELVADPDLSGVLSRLPVGASDRLRMLAEGHGPRRRAPRDQPVSRIIVSNRIAMAAAAEAGRQLGWSATLLDEPLEGDAAEWGKRLVGVVPIPPGQLPLLLVAGGETTVALPPGHRDPGGRCQELALAAAKAIRETGRSILVLAAGTDGRDGPTEAAGALVDAGTWDRIRLAGLDPDAALAGHASHDALEAADALVITGPTGTNVADLVLVLRDEGQALATTCGPEGQ